MKRKVTNKATSIVTSVSKSNSPRALSEIPVIDIFAGPGGLGEGFASAGFNVALSCEMDPVACETLQLRKFYHLFDKDEVPEDYYRFIKGDITLDDLKNMHPGQFETAQNQVMQVELGDEESWQKVHDNIRDAISGFANKDNFVLIGGPPCQAYSLAGRSRRKGLGKQHTRDKNNQRLSDDKLPDEVKRKKENLAKEFYSDPKHKLYLEYLQIIAVHRPAVFVMENVKGMTSARSSQQDTKAGSVFEKVIADLSSPGATVSKSLSSKMKKRYGFQTDTKYRLVSMTRREIRDLLGDPERLTGRDFVIKSEYFGVPQARHRVFIVGVREDIEGAPDTIKPHGGLVTVKQMIADMPKLRSGLSKEPDTPGNWVAAIWREYNLLLKGRVQAGLSLPKIISRITRISGSLSRGGQFVPIRGKTLPQPKNPEVLQWISDERLGGVVGHETRGHMAADLARYLFCSAYAQNTNERNSPKLEDWPSAELLPDHSNVISNTDDRGEIKVTAETHSDRFRVQLWDRPSTTVVSHISKDGHYYIHPDPVQCRSLTVREAARLQTFPENYFFAGGRTAQYHQVGNAVPPFLAKQIAESIRRFLTTKTVAEVNLEKRNQPE